MSQTATSAQTLQTSDQDFKDIYTHYPQFMMRYAYFYADKEDKLAFQRFLDSNEYYNAQRKMEHLIYQRYGQLDVFALAPYQEISRKTKREYPTLRFIRAMARINTETPSFYELSNTTKDKLETIAADQQHEALESKIYNYNEYAVLLWLFSAFIATISFFIIGAVLTSLVSPTTTMTANIPLITTLSLSLGIGLPLGIAAVGLLFYVLSKDVKHQVDTSISSEKSGSAKTYQFEPAAKFSMGAYDDYQFNMGMDYYHHALTAREQNEFYHVTFNEVVDYTHVHGRLHCYEVPIYNARDFRNLLFIRYFGCKFNSNQAFVRIKDAVSNERKAQQAETERDQNRVHHATSPAYQGKSDFQPLFANEPSDELKIPSEKTIKRVAELAHDTYGLLPVYGNAAKGYQVDKPVQLQKLDNHYYYVQGSSLMTEELITPAPSN